MRPVSIHPGYRGYSGQHTRDVRNDGHLHGDLELNIVRGGDCTYTIAGQETMIPDGVLAVFWGALPHAVTSIDPATEMDWIIIPIATVLRWGGASANLRRLLRGEVLLDSEQDGSLIMRRWLRDLESRDEELQHASFLEIEARVRRLLRAGNRAAVSKDAPARADAVSRMTNYLAENYRHDCPAEVVAAAGGLHPAAARRAFRRRLGVSIHQYLVQMRLAHAHRLLMTTSRDVLSIAMESGFGSLGRFYAAFTKAFGGPPAALRRGA